MERLLLAHKFRPHCSPSHCALIFFDLSLPWKTLLCKNIDLETVCLLVINTVSYLVWDIAVQEVVGWMMTCSSYVYEVGDHPSFWQYVKEAELSTCWQLLSIKETKTRTSWRRGKSVMALGTREWHLISIWLVQQWLNIFKKRAKPFVLCSEYMHRILSTLKNSLYLFPFPFTFVCTPQ